MKWEDIKRAVRDAHRSQGRSGDGDHDPVGQVAQLRASLTRAVLLESLFYEAGPEGLGPAA